jgi:hypothetical protein
MRCVSLTPGLFHDFKAAGSAEKQSLNNPWLEVGREEEVYSKVCLFTSRGARRERERERERKGIQDLTEIEY